ncbi:MAG: transglycosylase [Ruminococcaceae bacterium]|nr:transglycosylase [Oscillospiraceae bacterium]
MSVTTKKQKGLHAVKAFFKSLPMRVISKTVGALLKCIITILLIGVITFTVVASVMVVYVLSNFDGTEGLPDLADLSINETSIVYTMAEDGSWQEYQRLEGNDSIWVDLEDIPLNMQHAVVAIEDKRFYEHDGVDWRRTIAASANLVLHFQSVEFGGSTITQQFIKVYTGEADQTIERKITEIMRALRLEQTLDGSKADVKDQILEAYLNVLPLSRNVIGVGAAANNFFGKEVEDLSLAECAAIAGITQNPSKYDPFSHPENLRDRQRTVLRAMLNQGLITEDEYVQAVNEELHFSAYASRSMLQDYYVDLQVEEIAEDLMEKYGYSYNQAISKIYRGGLSIYSYENVTLQQKAEAIYADESNFPAHIESDDQDPQGAIFVIDYNGRVVATVGGRGKKDSDRVYNRSTDARRQCGSSVKPLGSYGPAIDKNLIHFSSLIPDAPITLPNGKKWPPNYGSTSTSNRGTTTVAYALKRSLNTTAAQLVQQLTPAESYSFMVNRLGFELEPQDKDYSALALGGFHKGVTCREMAEAYQIFGNGGYFRDTSTYAYVKQGDETLLEAKSVPVRVIGEDSAYVMNRLMQLVVREGTGANISGDWRGGWEVFAKTGTSGTSRSGTDYNVYFAGGTPQYVAASWFGYDYDKALNSRQTGYARSLWNEVMVALRNDNLSAEEKGFGGVKADLINREMIVEATYCEESGMLVGDNNTCTAKKTGVYKTSFMPDFCNEHVLAGTATTPDGGTSNGEPTTPGTTLDLSEIYGTGVSTAPTAAQ